MLNGAVSWTISGVCYESKPCRSVTIAYCIQAQSLGMAIYSLRFLNTPV